MTRKQPTRREVADQLEEREARIEEIIERAKQNLEKTSDPNAERQPSGRNAERSPPR